jgi:hypothetical protein
MDWTDQADALFAAGCDDGTPASSQGLAWIHFDREAASLEEAIRSAVINVQAAGLTVPKSSWTLRRRCRWARRRLHLSGIKAPGTPASRRSDRNWGTSSRRPCAQGKGCEQMRTDLSWRIIMLDTAGDLADYLFHGEEEI